MQISAMETNFREISDIFQVTTIRGLSQDSINMLPKWKFGSTKTIGPCHEMVTCTICLQVRTLFMIFFLYIHTWRGRWEPLLHNASFLLPLGQNWFLVYDLKDSGTQKVLQNGIQLHVEFTIDVAAKTYIKEWMCVYFMFT